MKKFSVLIVALTLAGCGSSAEPYSQSTRENFMRGCVVRDSDIAPCQCILSGMENTFTEEELIQIGRDLAAGGALPYEMYDIVEACQ